MSAPDYARRIFRVASNARPDVRRLLAYRWLDRGVRTYLPVVLEKAGHGASAEILRRGSEIRDRQTAILAEECLVRALSLPDGQGQPWLVVGAVLLVTLRSYGLSEEPDAFWISVGTLTAARGAGIHDEGEIQLEETARAVGE
jgi:hypothetical protein